MLETRTVFVLDAAALFALQLLQLFGLDYYVMIVFSGTWYSRYPNAVFSVLNVALTLLFCLALLACYRECERERHEQHSSASAAAAAAKPPAECKSNKYPAHLNCIAWAAYVTILFGKIILIFTNRIVSLVGHDDFMGPQMLKLLIGVSGIVFYLLVSAECVGRQVDHEKRPANAWIVEIFDSVEIVSIVITTHVQIGPVEYLVYATAFLNFMLPLWILYDVSRPHVHAEPMGLPQPLCYNFLHLMLVQMPFLGIRLYMWMAYDRNASVFIMKNVLCLMLFLHSLHVHVFHNSETILSALECCYDELDVYLTDFKLPKPVELP